MKKLTTEEIKKAYASTGLSDLAAITIQNAWEMQAEGLTPLGWKLGDVKNRIPDVVKYLNADHLKFAGAIKLNEKGRKLAQLANADQ